MPLAVDTAQPSAPSCGKPQLPNTSSQLLTMLNSRPRMAMTMIGLVWLMLVV
jgi:hypothetical protein